ncbi:Ribosome-recycling factor, mitochondrial [Frankliniella fusca]|uniref:Ribosome-recycling factor, mitochondrial n=1 Tax=Frankliniella fusca TaxID=407009 RepID=A0AAE1H6J2_9NEOP|nr:Ribosome-recycling factor, mitochondrial [Frankliniella fusca]
MSSLAIVLCVQRTFFQSCRHLSSSKRAFGSLRLPPTVSGTHFRSNSPLDNSIAAIQRHPFVIFHRDYASKKGGKKSKGSPQINTNILSEFINVDEMTQEMASAIDVLKSEYAKSLSLRSAGSVESIKVKFEGKEYELQQIAKLSRKGQQTIVVDMLSFPQMTKAVMDTLKTSAMNLNPQQEGTTIFIPIPKVTKEHREILAKKAKALFIVCRDSIKRIQENNIRELRDSPMADSEKQSAYKQIKALADKYVADSEAVMKGKQDELMGK